MDVAGSRTDMCQGKCKIIYNTTQFRIGKQRRYAVDG